MAPRNRTGGTRTRGPAPGPGRIRRRAVVAGVLGGIVLLFAFTAIVIRLAENAVRSEAESRVRTTAALSARLVGEQSLRFEELVTAYGQRLRNIGEPRRARLTAADGRTVRGVLGAITRGVDGIAAAGLTDPLGRVVAASPVDRLATGSDLSGREWYRGVRRTHRAYVSRAYISAATGHPKITVIATPVRAPGGRTIAILVVSEARRTQATTDALARQVGAKLTVLDQAGVVVARSGMSSDRLLSRARDPLVRDALAGRTGDEVRDVDGDRTVSGYAPVPTGWAVVADVPTSTAFADIPRLRAALIVASIVVAFLLLWLIPLLVSRLGRAQDALGVSAAFQSDLLPYELPTGVLTSYVASEKRMLLGGDFLDAALTRDGGVAMCIGDVCGHGPRAAALGATLRAAWRTLSFDENPVDRLALLDRIVVSERRDPDLFATLAGALVAPGGDRLSLVLAGHPPALLVRDGRIDRIEGPRGAALGLGAADLGWPVVTRELRGDWTLILYTDGLIEAHHGEGRLGLDGFERIVTSAMTAGHVDATRLLAAVAALSSDRALEDDVAMIVVDGAALAAASAEARLRSPVRG